MMTKHILLAAFAGTLLIGAGALTVLARRDDTTPLTKHTERAAIRPVVAAPPVSPPEQAPPPSIAAPPTAAEHGAELAAKLRDRAPATAAWNATARDVIDAWRASAGDVAARVQFGELECHPDGCLVEATYPDELAFEIAGDSLTSTEAFKSYPGWRHRSVRTDGERVVATWFFMNPGG